MDSLWNVPALESYPLRVPARNWQLWRRWRLRRSNTLRLELPEVPPMALELEERLWICVDERLADMPVLSWSEFRDQGLGLHEPVPCVVTHFHFGAGMIRERVLAIMARELEARLGAADASRRRHINTMET